MIKEKIISDQMAALKSHDQQRLSILRYILAQIKNKEIDKKPSNTAASREKSDLTEEETISVLRKIAKELHESIEAAKLGKRDDLVLENQKQLEVVTAYLPKELSDEELKKEIEKIIEKNKELYDKNPKAVIGVCVKALKSKVDPARIVKILQSYKP
ncbi:hypothetical protein A3A46_03760 [Candidatus Roizmanbacteria bacterium RIFCSPLOWO2_01_FULL_37_13]|uniref:Asn/Gln amidotransferase domain-containing protein n=1 Tax=Candidatus Roizmanbacteria bacterium RIFCSPHIGHO2_02_FULL_38_11 TaxID=1802039 RepID=A0A1F7H3L7_9BACT|nr:MAG: hypothetical protein A3C25_00540 [Candidatus Roizmanbacteria bacterium RIFCSPHIGHO2_02_FULL_38_11]OGK33520.1 MAG: hypothetical protein A3F58_01820 [Candidatus Roizmanbacteria bacterium RIFCSPHIGHO2_12_FULL_37_9b]OGK41039.1 MAG: hypothetical protein A3A46_03760 [Candidatus Roizmanbacteria bacterium RIFCSPLOWO2_01_FULL_37_13]